MTTALLTVARNALWNSINNWSELKKDPGDTYATVLNQCYTFDGESPLLEEMPPAPSMSDLPALAIMHVDNNPAWWTNEMMMSAAVFQAILWTQDWSYPEPERLIEFIRRAFYQAKPPAGQLTYIQSGQVATPPGTGYLPIQHSVSGPRFATSGKDDDAIRVTITTLTIALCLQFDPLTD